MKNLLLLIFCTSILIFSSCGKEDIDIVENAKLEYNCTGYYLFYNDLPHIVCNDDLLIGYENGSSLSVKVENVEKCSDEVICALHQYRRDYPIEIKKIY